MGPVLAPTGTFALILVGEAKGISAVGTRTPPNLTTFFDGTFSNRLPSMVTSVPIPPLSGLKLVITGQQPVNISKPYIIKTVVPFFMTTSFQFVGEVPNI
jgi:hypothetical protein